MKSPLILTLIAAAAHIAASASNPTDNVHITSLTEEYRLTDGKQGPTVKNSLTETFEATRRSADVEVAIYYNDYITLDKVSGAKNPQYRHANSPTVFHDDSRFCYFTTELPLKGKKARVSYKRTFLDPAHLARVYLSRDYPIDNGTVTFVLPPSMSGIRLIDRNFDASRITREETSASDGTRTITYTLRNLPPVKDEPRSPTALSAYSCVLVAGYFPDTDSLWRYHRRMLDVNTHVEGIDALVADICRESVSRADSIAAIYRFVQSGIRYVAYEAGEAGYRPDSPAEVLRKKFGDCKGMALLLATLLRQAGYDSAKVGSVGTSDIPFNISDIPSLAATDHMICVLPLQGDTLWLDATNEYIPPTHIPQSIAGKDVMVFGADSYEMMCVPVLPASAATDSLTYDYALTPGGLRGTASRFMSGDMQEFLLTRFNSAPLHQRADVTARALVPAQNAAILSDSLRLTTLPDGSSLLTAPIANGAAVTEADGEIYLDLNTTGDPMTERTDTTDRTNDLALPLRARIVRRSEVTLPPGVTVSYLPDSYTDSDATASFSCTFSRTAPDRVAMTKTMEIYRTLIPRADIAAWNKRLARWHDACNHQIVLTKSSK
ncbi:MAG: transglutaminase family protein [Muribaculaceae bacterium]|nr:transglutaminase family protein [Muribaculaceae bacterium]